MEEYNWGIMKRKSKTSDSSDDKRDRDGGKRDRDGGKRDRDGGNRDRDGRKMEREDVNNISTKKYNISEVKNESRSKSPIRKGRGNVKKSNNTSVEGEKTEDKEQNNICSYAAAVKKEKSDYHIPHSSHVKSDSTAYHSSLKNSNSKLTSDPSVKLEKLNYAGAIMGEYIFSLYVCL